MGLNIKVTAPLVPKKSRPNFGLRQTDRRSILLAFLIYKNHVKNCLSNAYIPNHKIAVMKNSARENCTESKWYFSRCLKIKYQKKKMESKKVKNTLSLQFKKNQKVEKTFIAFNTCVLLNCKIGTSYDLQEHDIRINKIYLSKP